MHNGSDIIESGDVERFILVQYHHSGISVALFSGNKTVKRDVIQRKNRVVGNRCKHLHR